MNTLLLMVAAASLSAQAPLTTKQRALLGFKVPIVMVVASGLSTHKLEQTLETELLKREIPYQVGLGENATHQAVLELEVTVSSLPNSQYRAAYVELSLTERINDPNPATSDGLLGFQLEANRRHAGALGLTKAPALPKVVNKVIAYLVNLLGTDYWAARRRTGR